MGLLSVCPTTASAQVNYDTAWTFVYDGGRDAGGYAINDDLRDVKVLTNGVCRVIWRHI